MKKIILVLMLISLISFAETKNDKNKITTSIGAEIFRDHPFQSDGYNNVGSMLYGTIELNEKYTLMVGYADNSFGNEINYIAGTVNFGKMYFAGIGRIEGYNKVEQITDSEGNTQVIDVILVNDNGIIYTPVFGTQHRISENATARMMFMGTALSFTIELGFSAIELGK